MAQRVEVYWIDDLFRVKGQEVRASQEIAFEFDGDRRVIHLTDDNAYTFRRKLDPYVAASEPAPVRIPARERRETAPGTGRRHSATIRAWALARGYNISERGRIPAKVIADYEAAEDK